MTTITTTCAGCGRQLAVPERYLGRDLKCPDCGHPFRFEAPASRTSLPAQAPTPAESQPSPAPQQTPPSPPPEAAGPFADLFTAPEKETQPSAEEAEGPATMESGPVYWRLKRLGVLSAALVAAGIYGALGLVVGIVVAVASVFLPAPAIPLVRGRLVGGLAIVVFPLLYGAAGFAAGALTALLYNLTARFLGGVRVLLE
jgi:predicted RNA-binding Zn-ribbon protein involved in translation (DUF1610 family)